MKTYLLIASIMLFSVPTFSEPSQNPVANPQPSATSTPDNAFSSPVNTGIHTGNGFSGMGVMTNENGAGSENGIHSGIGEHNAAAGGSGAGGS
ncbi:MAG: hypothetical protein H0U57_09200 [Tatlockia sp.]|nr:hypothetical protein [Tatlockia sp.]